MCVPFSNEEKITLTQQIHQVKKPPAPGLQVEDKSYGRHDGGRDGTEERTVNRKRT